MALTLSDPTTEAGYDFLLILGIGLAAYLLVRWLYEWREYRAWAKEMNRKNRRA